MKPLLPALLVAAAVVGTGSLAAAQQPAAPASVYSEADARAVLNARLAALKTVIELTPEQEKLWAPLEAAIRDISKNAAKRRQEHEKVNPKDFLDMLEVVAADDEARAKDLQKFVAAAKPLVAALTPEQKLRIPAFLGLTEGGRTQPSSEMWIFEEEE